MELFEKYVSEFAYKHGIILNLCMENSETRKYNITILLLFWLKKVIIYLPDSHLCLLIKYKLNAIFIYSQQLNTKYTIH